MFLERIQIILEFPKASDIDQLEPLTKLDIKAFLESLLLFQYAELSANILKKPLSQENRKEISTIASSQAMEEAGGFKVSQPIYYGNFDKVDFRYLLTKLQEKIKKTDYIDPIPFLLNCTSQSGALHAISIVYKPGGLWQFMDINRFPNIPELEIDALIENLEQESFNNFHAFTIQAVLPMEEKKGFAWDDMSFGQQKIIGQLTTQNMEKLLYLAAKKGHLEVVKALLAGGVDPNQAATNGDTPLFLAASKGHIEVVKALLAGGVDPNPVVTDGITPLLTAAQNGHLKVVLALLARKTDLDNPRTNDAATPYLCVAQNGYHMVIKALLARKAAANNPDSDLLIMQLLTHYLRLPPTSSSAKPILDAIARLANDKSSNFEESIGCIYTLHLQHRFIAAFIIKRFIQFCLVLPFIYVVWKGQLTKTNTECAIAEFKEKYPLNQNLAARNESAPSLF